MTEKHAPERVEQSAIYQVSDAAKIALEHVARGELIKDYRNQIAALRQQNEKMRKAIDDAIASYDKGCPDFAIEILREALK